MGRRGAFPCVLRTFSKAIVSASGRLGSTFPWATMRAADAEAGLVKSI